MGAGALQVGRESERELLAAVLRESASGHPGAVLVAGEAGIGKTSLVAEVTSGASDHLTLWGHCLRFGADSSPYLPIGQMLTQWYRQAGESERTRVLAGAEHLATIAPALGVVPEAVDFARALPLVASVLDRIAETGPLTLVVDDAQWADGTSLDLLAYVLAGFGSGQRLCLFVTYRDTDLGEGHRLHGWLADAIRLPFVSRLRLERLGYADSEELVIGLCGGATSSRVAADVYEKARGNPYYTELLVRDYQREPGSEQDDGLHQVLLGSWHRLGPDARELLQVLALGGRPVAVGVLERLVAARGGAREGVASSLTETTAAGLTTVGAHGEAWFHHPLVAEVVASTLTSTSSERVHRDYVEALRSFTDLTPASRATHLALHHHGAGDPDLAFSWSLRAAAEAAQVRGYAEASEHLHRACLLWPEIGTTARAAAGTRADLWRRASDSAWSAGRHLLAVRLREEAIAGDDEGDPTGTVRLRLPLHSWRRACGLDHGPPSQEVDATRAVLALAESRCPETPEHAQALARQAHAEVWNEDEAAVAHAAEAVRMARRTGSAEALAWALSVRSETPPKAFADATEALALAGHVGDAQLLGWAAVRTASRLDLAGRYSEAAHVLLTAFRDLVSAGSVHDAMYAGPAYGSWFLVELGRWEEARDVLRLLLSHRLTAGMASSTRGVAALLALRTGDVSAGRTHLARARELQPRSGRAGEMLEMVEMVEIEAQWALGQPREALALAAQLMPADAVHDPGGVGELLVVAARSAGDLAERPSARHEARTLLERVEHQAPEPPWFGCVGPHDLIHPARGSLFVADRARCHGDADTTDLWRTAVTSCSTAGMVWHEALASYRLGRALLSVRGSRQEAASVLRHGARLAHRLGARPILDDVEELARQSHISLEEPADVDPARGFGDPLASLTPREQEVLSHLVAGRTYAEIAEALFISEKTVSVHVSNLLRKTGTRSRLEVADLVRHTATSP
ncbi:MAG: helix-turn-helix transcriptional regulator [Nocardioides sp.]